MEEKELSALECFIIQEIQIARIVAILRLKYEKKYGLKKLEEDENEGSEFLYCPLSERARKLSEKHKIYDKEHLMFESITDPTIFSQIKIIFFIEKIIFELKISFYFDSDEKKISYKIVSGSHPHFEGEDIKDILIKVLSLIKEG